jgi:hypothetical protein
MVGASFTVAAVAEVLRSKKGIQAIGNAQVDTAQSKFGGASALFDGNGDYLTFSQSSDLTLGTNNFTVEMWVRPNNTAAQYQPVFSLDGNGYPLVLFQMTSGVMEGYISTSGSSWDFANVNIGTFTAGNWYHISVVRNGSTFAWYLNGTQTQTRTSSSSIIAQRSAGRIGTSDSAYYWNGWVDEIRISNSARYTANFTPSTTPFVNDANTLLLIHADGTDASTFFEDDNGVRGQASVIALGNAQISTSQSQFSGSSITVDGNADAIKIERITATNATFECWFRTNNVSGEKLIFVINDSSNNNIMVAGILGTQMYIYAGGTAAGGTVTANTWNHMVLTVPSSGSMVLFLNGVAVTSRGTIGSLTNYIIYAGGYFTGTTLLAGFIDEIRISNNIRYSTNFTPATAPFVNDANTLCLIHCDGTNASTVFRDDNGSRSQKGITAVGNTQIDTAQSKFGGSSALLDGTGDYLSMPYHPDYAYGSGDFTIEFWIRFNSLSTIANKLIWDQRPTATQGAYPAIYGNTSQKIIYYANGADRCVGTTTIVVNTWYHIAVSRSSGSTKLFINGTQEGSTYTDSTVYLTNSTENRFGQSFDGAYPDNVNGWIDEFRISNSARYTANFTAPTASFQNDANTVLLLHMDGTDASTAFFDDNGIAPYTP